MRHRVTILSMACILLASGCAGRFAADAGPIVLSGQVTYPQRIALPPNARAHVVLLDVTGAESDAAPVATIEIPEAGQVPIDFRLNVPRPIVDKSHDYVLRATITDGSGRTLWHMPEPHPVRPLADTEPVSLRVRQADGRADREQWARYACSGLSIAVNAGPERATIKFPDAERTLPRVRSASGAKYGGGETVFWGKGRIDALVEYQGRTYRNCIATSPTPAIGPHISAHGNEPYWSARVVGADGAGGIQFALGVSEPDVIRAPSARAERVGDGPTTVYRGRAADESIHVRVRKAQCTDSMSGRTFPLTVAVNTGERVVRGCGRRVGF